MAGEHECGATFSTYLARPATSIRSRHGSDNGKNTAPYHECERHRDHVSGDAVRSHDRARAADRRHGDKVGDLTVWRPGTGMWFSLNSSSGYASAPASLGNQSLGDVPLMGDLDGDQRADLAVWRASNGTWYWLTSSTGYAASQGVSRQWGSRAHGDVPMLADMDADGRMDLVVWRASTGTFYWLTSTSGYSHEAASRDSGSASARRHSSSVTSMATAASTDRLRAIVGTSSG